MRLCMYSCYQITVVHYKNYRQTFNTIRTLVGNKIDDDSDEVGALPVSAAPTALPISIWHLASMDWPKTTGRQDEGLGIWCGIY